MKRNILFYILFLFLSFNLSAQIYNTEYVPIEIDVSSYYYYTNVHAVTMLENQYTNLEIDYTSYYYHPTLADSFHTNLAWTEKKVIVNKFGGLPIQEKVKKEQEAKEKKKARKSIFPEWVLFFFLSSFIIVAFTNYYYAKYLRELFKAVFNIRASFKLYNESNILTGRSAMLLVINFYIIMTLALFLLEEYFLKLSYDKYFIFAGMFLIVIILFFIKNLFIIFMGQLTNIKKASLLYNFNISIYNQVLGLVLSPVLLLIAYFGVNYILIFFSILVILCVLIYLIRVIRAIKIFFYERYVISYLFLYLCLVEILPMLILLKVLFFKEN